jgi:tubulin delta
MIDTEPKVINSLINPDPKNSDYRNFSYDPKKAVYQQQGSGNNWAYGYSTNGVKMHENIFDKLRKMMEKLDRVEGVLVLQSLAGGTGSGVGSRVLKGLKTEIPELDLFSVAVLPRQGGEVVLQYYNSVFSLSSLYQECDGIFLFQNNHISQICKSVYNIKDPDFKDLNMILSNQIASFLFPTIPRKSSQTGVLQKSFSPFEDTILHLLR